MFGLLDVAALADRPADVVAGQVAHAERAHREAELLDRLVHLLRRGALVQQEAGLAAVLLDHAVADDRESVLVRQLAEHIGEVIVPIPSEGPTCTAAGVKV